MQFNKYSTLSQATTDLTKRGFTTQFDFQDRQLISRKTGDTYSMKDLEIIEYHRFQENKRTKETSMIFAIEANDQTRGTLVMAYDTNADLEVFKFLDKVRVKINSN